MERHLLVNLTSADAVLLRNGDEREETTMLLRTLFAKDIRIRLSNDATAFISTVRYAGLYSKTTEFPVDREPLPAAVAGNPDAAEYLVPPPITAFKR